MILTESDTTGNGLSPLDTALGLLAAGLCVLPIRRDTTKAPAVDTWPDKDKDGTPRLPTEAELRQRFGGPRQPAIAVAHGKVSGNSELIDFDRPSLFPAWVFLVESEAPGLVDRLTRIKTPGHDGETEGWHTPYRCRTTTIPGNLKLACEPYTDPKTGKRRSRTLIETRGEGGYALVPGSPADCHETGRPYLHHAGPPLTELAEITPEEREILLRCARSFDLSAAEKEKGSSRGDDLLPGTDFNERGPDWPEILWPHNWKLMREAGGVRYWQRPGKDGRGWSATTGYCHNGDGHDLLRVFSSNADPFEDGRAYSKFAAYAILNHGGDFAAAAKDLARQGYGTPPHQTNGRAQQQTRTTGRASTHAFSIGPLALRPGLPRRTAYKLIVPVDILKGGAKIDKLDLSSVYSGRRDAAKVIAAHAGDETRWEDVNPILGLILAAADESLSAAASALADAPTISEVLKKSIPDQLQLKCRTEKGNLWSETRCGELSRADFLACPTNELIDALALCQGAPSARHTLLKRVDAEMKLLWADLLDKLPSFEHADLGKNSAAGRQFRSLLIRVWTRPEMFALGSPERFSLAGRARHCKAGGDHWHRIHESYSAFWKPRKDGGILLGMRWDLPCQVKCPPLPGVIDQRSFVKLGVIFGALDPNPGVSAKLAQGGHIAIISQDLTSELMEKSSDGDPKVSE